jgi:hypothetical protein
MKAWIVLSVFLSAASARVSAPVGATLERLGFFSMVGIVALGIFVEIVMVVRLTRRGISCDKLPKLPWGRGRGHEVAATYEQVFPRSRLPLFRRFVFCLFPAWAGVFLLIELWKSN